MEIIQKSQVELNRAQFLSLRFYQKINQRIASWKNKLTERKARFYDLAGNNVVLDQSKTEWKAMSQGELSSADFVFEGRVVGGVLIVPTPSGIDLDKLETEFPYAYAACKKAGGITLRLNIKK